MHCTSVRYLKKYNEDYIIKLLNFKNITGLLALNAIYTSNSDTTATINQPVE